MKNRILIFLAVALMAIVSCNRDALEPVIPETTAEELIMALQDSYRLEKYDERDNSYLFTFHNPTPVTIDKEYPEGIREVTLSKSAVKTLVDTGRKLSIEFKDGKSAALTYYAWLEASLNNDFVSFGEDNESQYIFYQVEDSEPAKFTVSVVGGETLVSTSIESDKSGKGGCITFTPISSGYFTETIAVEFSNGEKNVSIPVSLIKEEFKFADGTVEKTFSFREYERYFEVGMSRADKSVEVSVPKDAPWLQACVSNVNVDGVDQTTLCFLLAENIGSNARHTTVTVSKEGIHREMKIDVSQIGSEMEGSLKRGLTAFYNSLNGANWNHNENWCSDKQMFDWYGITASMVASRALFGGDGFVYFGTDDKWILDLEANNMRGEIPMEFWQACPCFEFITIAGEYLPTSSLSDLVWHEGLVKLDLTMTFMKTPLTPAIANAKNLQTLNLQCCSIPGTIPEEITGLSHLREVNLRECGLTGTLPFSLGNLQELEILLLDHNMNLGGTLPSGFYQLHSLRSFDIGSTQIGGSLSPDIKHLDNLEDFYISGCEFEGTIPEEFGQLENLTAYDFQGNYFTRIPQFVRYIGFNSKEYKQWVGSAGFPLGVPYYQRNKKDGRPENYIVTVPNAFVIPDIIVDGKPLPRAGYYVDYDKCYLMPLPEWAHIKYGIYTWNMCRDGEFKEPVYPYADDLQYPANEYYFDGKDWRHRNLEYPAREYYYNGSSWVHDASCPWDKEHIEPENQ